MSQKIIEFYKIRDFGEKFNATIEFIRYNFSSLIKISILIAAPMGLLVGVILSDLFGSFSSIISDPSNMDNVEAIGLFTSIGLNYLLIILLSLISVSLSLAGIMSFMRMVYENKELPSVTEVYGRALKKLLGLMGLIVIIYLINIAGFIFFILPGIYLMIVFSLSIPCYMFEDISIGEAISKPFKLIKEKWWSTFGLLLISSMIASFSSYIFAIPFYILVFGEMFTVLKNQQDPGSVMAIYTGWKSSASTGFMMVGSFLTYMVPIIALSFQYFNLKERQEGTGLKSQIDNFENLD